MLPTLYDSGGPNWTEQTGWDTLDATLENPFDSPAAPLRAAVNYSCPVGFNRSITYLPGRHAETMFMNG